jgi:hypothetical protein
MPAKTHELARLDALAPARTAGALLERRRLRDERLLKSEALLPRPVSRSVARWPRRSAVTQ